MPRFEDLISHIQQNFPKNYWIIRWNESQPPNQGLIDIINIYNGALSKLDEESWKEIKEKLFRKINKKDTGRGQADFFNTLNETLAYEYLIDIGNDYVSFIKENKKETPDIVYTNNGTINYCEVKTINISNEEILRMKNEGTFDTCIYSTLTENFFSKLESTINKAKHQLSTFTSYGLIYIILNFDDFTNYYMDIYIEQLRSLIQKNNDCCYLYFRFGVLGKINIHDEYTVD